MEHPFLRVWSRRLHVPDFQNQRTGPQWDPRAPERGAVAAVLWFVFTRHPSMNFCLCSFSHTHPSSRPSRSAKRDGDPPWLLW